MIMRTIRGYDVASALLWEAMQFTDSQWEYKSGDKTYWLSTNADNAGFIRHRDMQEVIAFHLQAGHTYKITTSWGTECFIDNLIPGAIADLAVSALQSQE